MKTNTAGTWAKRETIGEYSFGKKERHYVRLRMLKGGTKSTLLCDFMANLIKRELERDPITDPNLKQQPK